MGKTPKLHHLNPISPEAFWKGLKAKSFGRVFYSFSEVTSTNDIASQLIGKGAAEGTLVTAEAQTRGRGRQGRVWMTSRGKALAFSLVLKPKLEIRQIPGITLAAAVAVSQTLEDYGLKPKIKWPNDLLLDGKKICGILTEMGPRYDNRLSVILGIGINLNQRAGDFPLPIRPLATSAYRASGRRVDRIEFLRKLMVKLETVYGFMHQKRFDKVLAEWRKRSVTLGQRVKVTQMTKFFEGQVVDIDLHGFLLVRRETGRIETVHSGDIEILKTKRH
ncbi:MAG TPA: biotin--[acetyl-CoA-carboxylase] ligase [bacterium]|nr:biotin--[acetyl-CoA-carboxylase] ligase [bacterium]